MKNNSRLIETHACMQELDDPKYEAASGAWLFGVSTGDIAMNRHGRRALAKLVQQDAARQKAKPEKRSRP